MKNKQKQNPNILSLRLLFLIAVLFAVAPSYGQLPTWMKIMVPVDSSSKVVSNAPFTELELASLLMPATKDNLIGSEIELSCSPLLMFQLSNFGHFWNSMLIESFYKDDGILLDMNQPQKQDNSRPKHFVFSIGLTGGSFMKEKLLFYTVSWKDAQTGKKTEETITGSIRHYYAKQNFIPQVEVFSKKGEPLEKGVVRFVRMGPGDHGKLQADFEMENGKVTNYTGLPLSAGHYRVTLQKPEECARIFRENLVIFPDDKPDAKKFHYQVSCEKTYEIYAYYHAPGFAKVSLKWPPSKIAFPAEGATPQVVHYQNLMQAGPNAKMDDFQDDKGNPLHFPFTIVYPQQRHTIYGGPGEDGTTVLYVGTLGGNGFYKNFDVKISQEALNSCEVSRENNGPIYVNLGFDLYGGAGQRGPNHQISPNWEQLTVTAWDPKTFRMMGQKMKHNPWPVDFPPILITKEDIEKFKTFERVEKTVSNGRATLKVVFRPVE